uniref:Uncharacterized protein n=1 Tax=Ciona intestinalis TaxID=7719 RepID=H2XKA2_CIOIN
FCSLSDFSSSQIQPTVRGIVVVVVVAGTQTARSKILKISKIITMLFSLMLKRTFNKQKMSAFG